MNFFEFVDFANLMMTGITALFISLIGLGGKPQEISDLKFQQILAIPCSALCVEGTLWLILAFLPFKLELSLLSRAQIGGFSFGTALVIMLVSCVGTGKRNSKKISCKINYQSTIKQQRRKHANYSL